MLCRGDCHAVVSLYHEALYRRSGFYKYRDTEGCFEAEIVEVKSDGHLVLHDRQDMIRSYTFKEVEFMLN